MPPSGHANPNAVIAVVISMTCVACIFVCMRFYARFGPARNIAGLDDLCIGISMVFAIGTTVTMILQVRSGMGRHVDDVEGEEIVGNLEAFWVSTWVYNLSLTFTKVSILFQYLRIFPQRWFRRCTWGLMGFIVAYGIYVFCTGIWLCHPVAFFWDSSIRGGTCLDRVRIWFVNAGLNIATDIATTVLPLPVLNNLELPTRQRHVLMAVFALGGFTCILSVLRLQSLYVVTHTDDVTWHNPLAATWSNVEMNTAVIASCLPTIRCLFPRLLKATSLGGSHSFPMRSDRSWGANNAGGHSTGSGISPHPSMAQSPRSTTYTTTTPGGITSTKLAMMPYQSESSDSSPTGFGTRGLLEVNSRSYIQTHDIEVDQHMPSTHGKIHVMTSIEQVTYHANEKSKRNGRESGESVKDLVKEKKPPHSF